MQGNATELTESKLCLRLNTCAYIPHIHHPSFLYHSTVYHSLMSILPISGCVSLPTYFHSTLHCFIILCIPLPFIVINSWSLHVSSFTRPLNHIHIVIQCHKHVHSQNSIHINIHESCRFSLDIGNNDDVHTIPIFDYMTICESYI